MRVPTPIQNVHQYWEGERFCWDLIFSALLVNFIKNDPFSRAVVAHTLNLSTQEAEVGKSLSSRTSWFTEFRDSQSYIEKHILEKTENKTKQKQQQKF